MASIIAKSSIPSLYSATAIEFICHMGYSGPISIILRTLLDKRYALPSRIISTLINFFCSFQNSSLMPVLWHQTLLVFAQRYKEDLEEDQVISIKHLLSCQHHPTIAAEIEFELGNPQIKR